MKDKISLVTFLILFSHIILCMIISRYLNADWKQAFAFNMCYLLLNELRIIHALLMKQPKTFKGHL